jgi:hypothetical protein
MHLYLLDDDILLMQPKDAIVYYLQGRDILDLTESLGMDPE